MTFLCYENKTVVLYSMQWSESMFNKVKSTSPDSRVYVYNFRGELLEVMLKDLTFITSVKGSIYEKV